MVAWTFKENYPVLSKQLNEIVHSIKADPEDSAWLTFKKLSAEHLFSDIGAISLAYPHSLWKKVYSDEKNLLKLNATNDSVVATITLIEAAPNWQLFQSAIRAQVQLEYSNPALVSDQAIKTGTEPGIKTWNSLSFKETKGDQRSILSIQLGQNGGLGLELRLESQEDSQSLRLLAAELLQLSWFMPAQPDCRRSIETNRHLQQLARPIRSSAQGLEVSVFTLPKVAQEVRAETIEPS